jgi:ABC-type transport system involved in cytochrome c biogenesis permease subunit
MKKVLDLLASLKLAVILLVLLLVGLGAGTIVESRHGTDAARDAVYYAWWFIGLQGVFGLSVLASIIVHYPWGSQRIGYFITHGSLLVILVGAVVTWRSGIDGNLFLWEGDSGNAIDIMDKGQVVGHHTLPFTVKLDDFQIETYPGTMRPSQFRSKIEITDPETGKTFPAAVWMNHEFTYKGFSLFQSSYQQSGGREASVLSVSRDPGQPIAFAGYVLLVAGMLTVLGTRIAQAKKRAALERDLLGGAGRAAAAIVALCLATGASAAPAGSWVDGLRRLPVQHDGRSMPFDTLAREGVWKVTGAYSVGGADPVATTAEWIFTPMAAASAPVVEVDATLAAAIGLPGGTRRASFAQLVNNRALLQLMDRARQVQAMGGKPTGSVASAEKMEERLVVMQGFLNRDALRVVPPPGNPNAAWGPPPSMGSVQDLVALGSGPRLDGWPSAEAIDREVGYNAARPTRTAWIVLLGALVLSILAWNGKSRVLDGLAFAGLLGGFAVMTWGIATRWAVAGRIPASNMFESLLFLAWGVGLFAVIALAALRNRLVVLNANAMAALTMALTDLLPIDGFIHPMAPVLSGTPWLAIHVPIIMVGYAVLALGMVIAHMQIGFTIFAPRRTELVARMYDLLYWYNLVGAILLVAGILTGSIWAASSWGRYWGWDPKEVWSLVAFLAYMAIGHAKVERLIGTFGVAAISVAAFQTILMTYLGVNFVLTSGMHSYGFGDSPVVKWMVVVAVVEAAFLVWGWLSYRRSQAAPAAAA